MSDWSLKRHEYFRNRQEAYSHLKPTSHSESETSNNIELIQNETLKEISELEQQLLADLDENKQLQLTAESLRCQLQEHTTPPSTTGPADQSVNHSQMTLTKSLQVRIYHLQQLSDGTDRKNKEIMSQIRLLDIRRRQLETELDDTNDGSAIRVGDRRLSEYKRRQRMRDLLADHDRRNLLGDIERFRKLKEDLERRLEEADIREGELRALLKTVKSSDTTRLNTRHR